MLTGAERVSLRILSIVFHHGKRSLQVIQNDVPSKRALILGAGLDGVSVLRALRKDSKLNYNVVGFLNDDPCKRGVHVGGVKVLGPLADLRKVLASRNINIVIVALPEISDDKVRRDIAKCRRDGVPLKIVPRISDVIAGKPVRLVDFNVEDLLKRTPSLTDITEIGKYLTDKRALVTGAGGSTGSDFAVRLYHYGRLRWSCLATEKTPFTKSIGNFNLVAKIWPIEFNIPLRLYLTPRESTKYLVSTNLKSYSMQRRTSTCR